MSEFTEAVERLNALCTNRGDSKRPVTLPQKMRYAAYRLRAWGSITDRTIADDLIAAADEMEERQ
jgi:hypothetical protein